VRVGEADFDPSRGVTAACCDTDIPYQEDAAAWRNIKTPYQGDGATDDRCLARWDAFRADNVPAGWRSSGT
jgi:hypothetical protein